MSYNGLFLTDPWNTWPLCTVTGTPVSGRCVLSTVNGSVYCTVRQVGVGAVDSEWTVETKDCCQSPPCNLDVRSQVSDGELCVGRRGRPAVGVCAVSCLVPSFWFCIRSFEPPRRLQFPRRGLSPSGAVQVHRVMESGDGESTVSPTPQVDGTPCVEGAGDGDLYRMHILCLHY